MVTAESIFSKAWFTSRIKVVGVFFLAGLASGMVSAWLASTPRLQTFLYIKGDKFLIPTYKFWTGFALVFSISLLAAYFISRRWLTLSPSVPRQLLALLVVVASPLVLYFSTDAFFALAPLYYVVFLPLAMCIITARLRLLPLALLQNVLILVAALIVSYLVFSLINSAQAVYEYVQTGIVQSLFAAAFGSWLSWTPKRFYGRAA